MKKIYTVSFVDVVEGVSGSMFQNVEQLSKNPFDVFEGGKEGFKRRLVNKITFERKHHPTGEISCKYIDECCCLGKFSLSSTLPSWEEIETNPRKITGDIFHHIAGIFNISVDSIIKPNELQELLLKYKWPQLGVPIAAAGGELSKVAAKAIAKISCMLGLLDMVSSNAFALPMTGICDCSGEIGPHNMQ